MGVFFRRSGAVNAVVGGPIWPKFKLVRDIMDVLVTYKFKIDLINNKPRKSGNIDFLDAQGQVTPKSVVGSCQNSNSSKLLCMSSFPASIKRIVP